MKEIQCPDCGHVNPSNRQSCLNCGFILEYAVDVSTAVQMVDCPMCQGLGQVHLEYLSGVAADPENQWLPCAACNGTGQRKAFELKDEQFRKGCNKFIEAIFYGLSYFRWP